MNKAELELKLDDLVDEWIDAGLVSSRPSESELMGLRAFLEMYELEESADDEKI